MYMTMVYGSNANANALSDPYETIDVGDVSSALPGSYRIAQPNRARVKDVVADE